MLENNVFQPVGVISLTPEQLDAIEAGAKYCEQHGIISEPMFGEIACPQCDLEEEQRFFDLDDRGMCPVCSTEQGKEVPIPFGETCHCGGYDNVSVVH
jgi:rubredoxin